MLKSNTIERNAEVINGGILAYSSYQGKKYFKKFVRKYQPDILIAALGYNDSLESITADNSVELMTERTQKMQDGLGMSATYRLMNKLLVNKPKKEMGLVKLDGVRVPPEDYRKNIEEIYDICREDGIHLLLLPISAPVKYRQEMQELSQSAGCGFIDIETIFQEHHRRFLKEGVTSYKGIPFEKITKRRFDDYHFKRLGSREMCEMRQYNILFIDYCHPTPAGHQIIAENIYNYLTDKGYFKDSGKDILSIPSIVKIEKEVAPLVPLLVDN